MNRKLTTIFSVLIVVIFIAFIIWDSARPEATEETAVTSLAADTLQNRWMISDAILVKEGALKAVAVSSSGKLYAGGDSFVSCYDRDMKMLWTSKTAAGITAMAVSGDTLFAATHDQVLVFGNDGKELADWGPFEDRSYITSVAARGPVLVYADAGNRMLAVLDRHGSVVRIIGQGSGEFVIPSPYFDVALGEDLTLYVANTGHRRIETRTLTGELKSWFGEPGLAADAFCGCCNPAHFTRTEDGFITAEKGVNRIKLLDDNGKFTEYVTIRNKFLPSVPLDLAYAGRKVLYGANPSDSRIYKFVRK